ncbi:hypothetical protein SAL_2112 [Streptococcus agalactiae 515]|nr:hypothetical protein SAL_2112 [Streptococcus agalactiae 515]
MSGLVITTINLSNPKPRAKSTGILSDKPPSKYFFPCQSTIFETTGNAELARKISICSKTLSILKYSGLPDVISVATT